MSVRRIAYTLVIYNLVPRVCVLNTPLSPSSPTLVCLLPRPLPPKNKAVEVLAPIMSQRAAMKRKSYCLVHQRQCFLRTARQQTAGSSCTAHSRQGKQLGLADANVLSLLAWVGLRLEVGESEATLENVDQFPTETLQRLLGSQYFIEPCRMDPRMFGLLVLHLQ